MKVKELIKKNIDNIIVVFFCVFAIVLGGCLSVNEISQDHWYIEGSADGLFGADNRSLMVLGSNFIVTGLIYILSLTGIRIYWLHLLLILILLVSNILICQIIVKHIKAKIKYALIASYLIIITCMMMVREFNYSAIAAYTIAAGCLILFENIENKNSYGKVILGGVLVVLGAAVRTDSMYFSIALIGIVWLCKVARKCYGKSFKEIKAIFVKYFFPFFGCLCILFAINLGQKILMKYEEGNYYEWNEVRAQVDDRAIPNYYEYPEEYEKIGISENDYNILKTWNNQDKNIFSNKVIKNIIDLSDDIQGEKNDKVKITEYIADAWSILSSYIEFWIILGIMFIGIIAVDKKLVLFFIPLLLGDMLLSVYFVYIGKTIGMTHIFVSIISVTYIATIVSLLGSSNSKCSRRLEQKSVSLILSIVILGGVLFLTLGEQATSLWDIYFLRRENENKLYSHLKYVDELQGKTETYNPKVSEYIEADKENFYYRLFVFDWYAQQYPLTDRNLLFTAPVGAAENWGALGQYQMNLSPIKSNMEKYGIENPIPDLIHENVRVEVKANCIEETIPFLNTYLKEHYYDDVDFSIIQGMSNCVIGRFLPSLDLEGLEEQEDEVKIIPEVQESEYEGMVEVKFEWEEKLEENQILYFQIEDEKGRQYRYQAIIKSDDESKLIIPATSIKVGENYKIVPIVEENDKKIKLRELTIQF